MGSERIFKSFKQQLLPEIIAQTLALPTQCRIASARTSSGQFSLSAAENLSSFSASKLEHLLEQRSFASSCAAFRAPTLMDWAAANPKIAKLVGGQDCKLPIQQIKTGAFTWQRE